jgi:hypothetical protein
VHREFRGEALAQQARATALDVMVRAGLPLRLVQLHQGVPRELRECLLSRR